MGAMVKMWMSKMIIACMAREKCASILEAAKEGFGHDPIFHSNELALTL